MGFWTLLLLLCIFPLQCSMQNIHFVTPTPSEPCPGEPCLTLSRYVEEFDQHFGSNVTLVFLPGIHVLELSVSIENVSALAFIGSSPVSLHTPSSIVCSASATFKFFRIEELHIRSLVFVSCGSGDANNAMGITSVADAEITNCIFRNSTSVNAYGGALVLKDSTAILTENVFEYNSAYSGGGVYVSNSTVMYARNTFAMNSAKQGGAVSTVGSRVMFFENSFIGNSAVQIGGGTSIQNSIANFTGNYFTGNTAGDVGAGVVLFDDSIGNFTKEKFDKNLANFAGAGVGVYESTVAFCQSCFTANDAFFEGGGVYVVDGVVELYGNTFANNTAGSSGGGVRITSFNAMNRSTVNLNRNVFMSNLASCSGGAINVDNCIANLSENVVVYNNAGDSGGGFFVEDSVANFVGNTFTSNVAIDDNGGCGYIQSSSVNFDGNVFDRCDAGDEGGALHVARSTLSFVGDRFHRNEAKLGGAIFIYEKSNVSFCSSTNENNFAEYGGSITAFESSIEFTGHTTISHSMADYGGGLYLVNTNLQISGKCNFYDNQGMYGGGFYASRTAIHFQGNTNFTGNSASEGGGFLLTVDSVTHILPNASIYLMNNRAEHTGGAIKVEDSNPVTYCFETLQYRSECFFQLEGEFMSSDALDIASTITVNFENNSAGLAGSDLYGGAIDNCIISQYAIPGGDVFRRIISDESVQISISSDPLRICHCNASTNEINCSDSTLSRRTFPGGILEISVIALGQIDGPVPATVRAALSGREITLHDLEYAQSTNNSCSVLLYNIYSSKVDISEVMKLSAEGPCPSNSKPLSVHVEVAACPHGLELSNTSQSCVCHQRLRQYTNLCTVESQSKSGTIFRGHNADFWVGFDQSSQEMILHPNCPFDFCTDEEMFVTIDDSDIQCNYYRNGYLCGGCHDGLSLVLGSSQCHQCSNNYLALLLVFAFAGIVLIYFIFNLKLTVATGTISGLIFYANLIQVNSEIFFPAGTTNFLTVFIAWLNLDLGIQTCFYDGMDAYSKIWLQFVFPIYVWSLVALVILLSRYSQRFANKISNCNPVPVLATLFHISYAKILRTIIAALSVTHLEYPNGVDYVWVYDGSVRYLKGKHVPLFLAALLCLLVLFIPYTLVLFFGQWLSRMKWKAFSWINKPRIRSFIDAYHAPYLPQHRYWTGLLCLFRCILFLIIAVYGRHVGISLLAVSVATLTLTTISLLTGGVYKSRLVGAVEAFFILNLGVLSVGTFYVKLTGGSQRALAFTSVSIAFAVFAVETTYRAYLRLQNMKVWEKIANFRVQHRSFDGKKTTETTNKVENNNIEPIVVDSDNNQPKTVVWNELRESVLELMI